MSPKMAATISATLGRHARFAPGHVAIMLA